MDTSGFCQVGRYGTLCLLKRHVHSAESANDNVVTSFGIDDEELTFGSSTTCGVRLYYSDVESLHCKIVFDEYKAFLAVSGVSGVVVDGCSVYPHTSGESPDATQQTIIPLSNNSIFEIHGKRFKFTYPPKQLRKTLYATPARPPQRALRLSMIHSAQVFSPRPSNDPQENLRILQSPVKNPSLSPTKQLNHSPLKSAIIPDDDEEIVLVHTNCPRVVEEEKDLVILEDIPVQLLSPSKPLSVPERSQPFPVIRFDLQPCTPPRRRALGGTALHRAVLIRSAQRAIMKTEKEREEEEEEEMEVLGAVVHDVDDEDVSKGHGHIDEDVEMQAMEAEQEDEENFSINNKEDETQSSPWHKGLEKIVPWSFNGSEFSANEDEDQAESEIDSIQDAQTQPSTRPCVSTTPRRNLGSFMTPQPRGNKKGSHSRADLSTSLAVPGRLSLGGEARRVLVQQPWKIHDLVVPTPSIPAADSRSLMPVDPPSEEILNSGQVASPCPPTTPTKNSTPTSQTPRFAHSVSDEERKAIQERRRSAVKDLGSNLLWVGGAPGMSPSKRGILPSLPSEPDSFLATNALRPSSSPTKGHPSFHPIVEEDESNAPKMTDEEVDTRELLEKMKETVNDMKRRRSVISGAGGVLGTPRLMPVTREFSPKKSTTPTVVANATADTARSIASGSEGPKEGTPIKPLKRPLTPGPSRQEDVDQGKASVKLVLGDEPFSLLRPGALEGRRQTLISVSLPSEEMDPEAVVPVSLPVVIVDEIEQNKLNEGSDGAAGPSPWLLHTPQTRKEEGGEPEVSLESDTGDATKSKVISKSTRNPVTRRQRSRTPQPQPSSNETITQYNQSIIVESEERLAASSQPRRGRKADSTIKPETVNEEIVAQTEKAPPKRSRKLRMVTELEAEDRGGPTLATRSSRSRKNASVEIADDPSIRDETIAHTGVKASSKSARKPNSKARSTTKAIEPTPIEEETETGEDVLDSFNIAENFNTTPIEVKDSVPPRTTRTESKTTVGKKEGRIKVEEDTPTLGGPALPRTTRAGRNTKSTAVAQTPGVTPITRATVGKTRGRPKTPATAPTGTAGTSIGAEKENTPRLGTSAESTEKASEPEVEDVPMKLRVSRTRTGSRNAVKVEEDEQVQHAAPTRQRATRTMRTRTKTS